MIWREAGATVAGLALCLGSSCTDQGTPEYVADQFVDAYFRRMDQAFARQFTALGATEMLDREIELTRAVRAGGYGPDEAAGRVVVERKARSVRGERVHYDYEISIRHEGSDGTDDHRAADIELAKIQSAWKVVLVDLKAR